ncbi:cupin domain-containing protein [Microlunatus speluncae]|uniref:cupin domain-containing protein n=1 Tax=Microlunatus speluncae TaxID=2594267 RepID=UPI001FE339D2|nr:cupin domain-containing protein [Microlunatus speluncae]
MDALELLTGDAQTFSEKVWAHRVGRYDRDPESLVDRLSLDDADKLITSSAMRTPQLRLARDGAVLPEASYTRKGATIAGKPLTGLIDVRRTLRLFRDGATIVFQGLHRYWPPLTELIGALETELGHPCQANAYLTPPGAQGFAVHSDTHDVFVFQTHGSKLWEIHDRNEAGERVPEQVRFTPGLVMYLPTGTPHAARAEDGVSLHVTIGINQLTWRGLLTEVITETLAGMDDEHLPAGYPDDPSRLSGPLATKITELTRRLGEADADQVATGQVHRFLTGRNPRLRGALLDGLELAGLIATTTLRRRPGSRCVPEPRGDRLVLLLGDRELDVPGRLRPVIDQLLGFDDRFRAADLDLDPESALVLCRRLIIEGLLELDR